MKRRQPSLAVVVPWTIVVVLTAIGGLVLWLTRSDDASASDSNQVVTFDLAEGRQPLPTEGRLCYAGFLTPQEQVETFAVVDLGAEQADIAVLYGTDESEILIGQGPLDPVETTEHVFDVMAQVPDGAGGDATIPVLFTLASNRLSLPGEAVLAVSDCAAMADKVATLDGARQG